MRLYLKAGDARHRCITRAVEEMYALPKDKDYEVLIDLWRPPEDHQRNYYNAMLRYLGQQMQKDPDYAGWSRDDWNMEVKRMLGVQTTAGFGVKEWNEFLTELETLALYRWGIDLPEPNKDERAR